VVGGKGGQQPPSKLCVEATMGDFVMKESNREKYEALKRERNKANQLVKQAQRQRNRVVEAVEMGRREEARRQLKAMFHHD
jgi:hypothetical protein